MTVKHAGYVAMNIMNIVIHDIIKFHLSCPTLRIIEEVHCICRIYYMINMRKTNNALTIQNVLGRLTVHRSHD